MIVVHQLQTSIMVIFIIIASKAGKVSFSTGFQFKKDSFQKGFLLSTREVFEGSRFSADLCHF